jgi:hypothetical protein
MPTKENNNQMAERNILSDVTASNADPSMSVAMA